MLVDQTFWKAAFQREIGLKGVPAKCFSSGNAILLVALFHTRKRPEAFLGRGEEALQLLPCREECGWEVCVFFENMFCRSLFVPTFEKLAWGANITNVEFHLKTRDSNYNEVTHLTN